MHELLAHLNVRNYNIRFEVGLKRQPAPELIKNVDKLALIKLISLRISLTLPILIVSTAVLCCFHSKNASSHCKFHWKLLETK